MTQEPEGIFRKGMEIPQDIDGFSAPPKGYKHLLDASGRDPVERLKRLITTNFPAVSDILVFHESKSDIGGKMIVHFLYNGKPVSLRISDQQWMNTLTNEQYGKLASHMQGMAPFERGIFNVILQHVHKLEKARTAIKGSTHAALADINPETMTA